MDTKKAPSSATRKISHKDGRYLDDSNRHLHKSVRRSRTSREKSSRSPLRATTLESNIKITSHVAFRDPLASYREASASSTPNERDILLPASGFNAGEQEERDFESTCSSAVANTNVQYLNDRPAIDALELRLSGSPNEFANSTLHTYRGVRTFETLQPNSSFNSSNHRLETLKRRQPEAKLEKLKERIRRQWELAGEKDVRKGLYSSSHCTDPTANAKTRKVTSAPPPPAYRGFNPPDTNICTLDGKLCKEDNSHSVPLYGTLQPSFQEVVSTNEKSQIKNTSRPVQKVQRLASGGSTGMPESKPVKGSVISTSSWRDGQKLVKQLLGPTPKIKKELKALSDGKHTLKETPSIDGPINKRQGSFEKDTGKRSVSSERQIKEITKPRGKQIGKQTLSREKQTENEDLSSKTASSVGYSKAVHENNYCRDPATTTSFQNDDKTCNSTLDNNKYHTEPAELRKDFLPLEIRGILDDLQLDSGIEGQKQTRGRSKSPTKRKPGKSHALQEPHISSKRSHYDTEQVRLYILRQQEERKRKQNDEKEEQRQAEEQKNIRLQELYQKQKEAFSKAKDCTTGQHVQETELQDAAYSHKTEHKIQQPPETVSRLMLRHAWSDLSAQVKQVLYQPSGESDKENKGQERPTSASSGSDLSLSEPLQPLIRSDLADTYHPMLDSISSKCPLPQNQKKEGDFILSHFLNIPKDLESLLSSRKSTANPETNKTYLQRKPPSNFRSSLDRIESLKATAVSLSSRIESEAKKLAGGSLVFPSTWGSDPNHINNNTTIWKKPESPPERDDENDIFSAEIQKMIGTCESHFSHMDLPGANDLYKKLPDRFLSNRTITNWGREVINYRRLPPGRDESCRRPIEFSSNISPLQNSSTCSISEGPLLSEGNLNEGEGIPSHGSPLFSNKLTKAFSINDQESRSESFEPLEFKREADNYEPLVTSSAKGPWEELAKGSPNSIVNIFTKSYQLYSNELEGRVERNSPVLMPPFTLASHQNSVSYADDFNSCQVSQTPSGTPIARQQSSSSVNEELPMVKSRNEGTSSSSSGASYASSSASYLSQEGSKLKNSFQNDSSHIPQEEQSSSCSKHKNLASKHRPLSPGREPSAGTDTDSTIGDLSSRSVASFLSDSGRDVESPHTNFTEIGMQTPAPPTAATTGGSVTQPSDIASGPVQGSNHYSPVVLQQHMSAELNYLSATEESVRQLCDVERVHGISLAQQETVSLAQIMKAQAENLQRFQKTLDTSNPLKQDQVLEALAHSYLSPSSSDRTVNSLDDQQNRQSPVGIWKKGLNYLSTSPQPTSSASSIKEASICGNESPSISSVTEAIRSESNMEESIVEELAITGLQEKGIPTVHEKDSQSAVSVNEEGMEEQSFRSLLPSEAHRRGSLERQRSQRHESDEESTPEKELSGPFASGQDSFWKFTMEMVHQYMQEGEMRSTHQSALLRLRQKALKDKTKAELAWLEHLKRRLHDKGEDDKMPPLRKRQRGLLLRLQQEQAEIKRLQEANKAARRERQLILKQQEEIQRIQNSTLKLQEKLKSAESGELPSEVKIQPGSASSHVASDADSRSPSPVSVSGSETSSIMQKLRKMHSHMDSKFLTKREQELVQRRLHAQELLEWKRRLDEEELKIRWIEKQALAGWDNQKVNKRSQSHARDSMVEEKNEKEGSSVPSSPSMQTNTSGSLPPEYLASEISESTISEKILEQIGEHSSISEELLPSSHSKGSPLQSNKSPGGGESSKDSVIGQQMHTPLRPHHPSQTWSEESLSMTHSDTTSDQSDIEGRIRALKDELKKRKSVVDNLKREQKKRQKERLRAQEAILLQQLKSYDEYILKTQAELSGEHGTASVLKPAPKNALASAGTNLAKSDVTSRLIDTPTYKMVNENENQVDFTTDASVSQEISSASNKEVSKKTKLEQSSVSYKDNANSTIQSCPLSPPLRDYLLTATPDCPVSTIHSEIPEEMIESHLSASPFPAALNLNLRSQTPEETEYLSRDHSYSDDFEASAPFRYSVSETPREELEISYATTPGRELPSLPDHEEEHNEFRSTSPHVESSTLNPPAHNHLLSSEITHPLAHLCLGDRVLVSGVQPGTLRFKGTTLFAEGLWTGIELDMPEGNNDGSHGGEHYFTCKHQHGIFAPPHKITSLSQEKLIQKEEYILSDEVSLDHKNETDYLSEPKSEQETTLEVTEHLNESQNKTEQNLFLSSDFNLDRTTETSFVKEEKKESNSPLVDLLIKDENEQDAFKQQAPNLNILSESLLQHCLKDTISYLQNVRKQREERVQQSNQELKNPPTAPKDPTNCSLYLKNKEAPNDEIRPQLDLAEIEPSCSLLSEEPDWFDEDFGLSTCRAQQREMKQAQLMETIPEPCLVVPEPIPKPVLPLQQPEPFLAVPHTALKVEQLVCVATDELWKWKELSGDLQEIRTTFAQDGDEEQNPAKCAYKAVVFDLTHQIFEEMCCSDQMEMQPPWKKPSRVSPTSSRQVRNPHNLVEIKSILIDEVLSLLNLKKEQNHKTDWQRMMKFGRKKRDRVDEILVKELHEEEAQWVNYDEDELFVKMQLADGIFEALIRDTVQVLQSIEQKKNLLLLV